MKRLSKIIVRLTGFLLGGVALIIAVLIYFLNGPFSQASLTKKFEAHNLTSIGAANLPVVDSLPSARPEIPRKWVTVAGFKSPVWPASRRLAHYFHNGPLEGNPYKENRAIIFNSITLIETHGWFNGRDWGLAYTTTTNRLPSPYWTKHLVGDWSVWYIGGGTPPESDGLWYE